MNYSNILYFVLLNLVFTIQHRFDTNLIPLSVQISSQYKGLIINTYSDVYFDLISDNSTRIEIDFYLNKKGPINNCCIEYFLETLNNNGSIILYFRPTIPGNLNIQLFNYQNNNYKYLQDSIYINILHGDISDTQSILQCDSLHYLPMASITCWLFLRDEYFNRIHDINGIYGFNLYNSEGVMISGPFYNFTQLTNIYQTGVYTVQFNTNIKYTFTIHFADIFKSIITSDYNNITTTHIDEYGNLCIPGSEVDCPDDVVYELCGGYCIRDEIFNGPPQTNCHTQTTSNLTNAIINYLNNSVSRTNISLNIYAPNILSSRLSNEYCLNLYRMNEIIPNLQCQIGYVNLLFSQRNLADELIVNYLDNNSTRFPFSIGDVFSFLNPVKCMENTRHLNTTTICDPIYNYCNILDYIPPEGSFIVKNVSNLTGILGTRLHLQCLPGYKQIIGNGIAECMEGGKYIDHLQCSPLLNYCSWPPFSGEDSLLIQGFNQSFPTLINSQVDFTCSPGYYPVATEFLNNELIFSLICDAGGTWAFKNSFGTNGKRINYRTYNNNNNRPLCQLNTSYCQIPNIVPNMNTQQPNFKFNLSIYDISEISCNPGYRLNKHLWSNFVQCQEGSILFFNGTTYQIPPSFFNEYLCLPILNYCNLKLSNLGNAQLTNSTTSNWQIGTNFTFACSPGYIYSTGALNLYCDGSGNIIDPSTQISSNYLNCVANSSLCWEPPINPDLNTNGLIMSSNGPWGLGDSLSYTCNSNYLLTSVNHIFNSQFTCGVGGWYYADGITQLESEIGSLQCVVNVSICTTFPISLVNSRIVDYSLTSSGHLFYKIDCIDGYSGSLSTMTNFLFCDATSTMSWLPSDSYGPNYVSSSKSILSCSQNVNFCQSLPLVYTRVNTNQFLLTNSVDYSVDVQSVLLGGLANVTCLGNYYGFYSLKCVALNATSASSGAWQIVQTGEVVDELICGNIYSPIITSLDEVTTSYYYRRNMDSCNTQYPWLSHIVTPTEQLTAGLISDPFTPLNSTIAGGVSMWLSRTRVKGDGISCEDNYPILLFKISSTDISTKKVFKKSLIFNVYLNSDKEMSGSILCDCGKFNITLPTSIFGDCGNDGEDYRNNHNFFFFAYTYDVNVGDVEIYVDNNRFVIPNIITSSCLNEAITIVNNNRGSLFIEPIFRAVAVTFYNVFLTPLKIASIYNEEISLYSNFNCEYQGTCVEQNIPSYFSFPTSALLNSFNNIKTLVNTRITSSCRAGIKGIGATNTITTTCLGSSLGYEFGSLECCDRILSYCPMLHSEESTIVLTQSIDNAFISPYINCTGNNAITTPTMKTSSTTSECESYIVKNGQLVVDSIYSAHVACDEGYEVYEPYDTIYCMDKIWKTFNGLLANITVGCRGIPNWCNSTLPTQNFQNTRILSHSLYSNLGSQVRIGCTNGYTSKTTIYSQMNLTCSITHEWIPSNNFIIIDCSYVHLKYCPSFVLRKDGITKEYIRDQRVNATTYFNCPYGEYLIGSSNVVCGKDGEYYTKITTNDYLVPYEPFDCVRASECVWYNESGIPIYNRNLLFTYIYFDQLSFPFFSLSLANSEIFTFYSSMSNILLTPRKWLGLSIEIINISTIAVYVNFSTPLYYSLFTNLKSTSNLVYLSIYGNHTSVKYNTPVVEFIEPICRFCPLYSNVLSNTFIQSVEIASDRSIIHWKCFNGFNHINLLNTTCMNHDHSFITPPQCCSRLQINNNSPFCPNMEILNEPSCNINLLTSSFNRTSISPENLCSGTDYYYHFYKESFLCEYDNTILHNDLQLYCQLKTDVCSQLNLTNLNVIYSDKSANGVSLLKCVEGMKFTQSSTNQLSLQYVKAICHSQNKTYTFSNGLNDCIPDTRQYDLNTVDFTYAVGDVYDLSCKNGYIKLFGSSTLRCSADQSYRQLNDQTAASLKCVKEIHKCPLLLETSFWHYVYFYDNILSDEGKIRIRCNSIYIDHGSFDLECLGGEWWLTSTNILFKSMGNSKPISSSENVNEICFEKRNDICNILDLNTIDNLHILENSTNINIYINSIVHVQCNNGFISPEYLNNTFSIKCLSNGNWSIFEENALAKTTTCIRHDFYCESPFHLNIKSIVNNNYLGATDMTEKYICDSSRKEWISSSSIDDDDTSISNASCHQFNIIEGSYLNLTEIIHPSCSSFLLTNIDLPKYQCMSNGEILLINNYHFGFNISVMSILNNCFNNASSTLPEINCVDFINSSFIDRISIVDNSYYTVYCRGSSHTFNVYNTNNCPPISMDDFCQNALDENWCTFDSINHRHINDVFNISNYTKYLSEFQVNTRFKITCLINHLWAYTQVIPPYNHIYFNSVGNPHKYGIYMIDYDKPFWNGNIMSKTIIPQITTEYFNVQSSSYAMTGWLFENHTGNCTIVTRLLNGTLFSFINYIKQNDIGNMSITSRQTWLRFDLYYTFNFIRPSVIIDIECLDLSTGFMSLNMTSKLYYNFTKTYSGVILT